MKKVLLLCFLSAGALWASAASGGGLPRLPLPPDRPMFLPAHPAADYFRRICKSTIEARGILNTKNMPNERRVFPATYVDYLMTGLDGSISINGKLYPLDFGTNSSLRDRARALNGKRVILRGQLDIRHLPLNHMLEGGATEALRTVEYVLVTSIEEQSEYINETVEVELQGRFQSNFVLGFDGTSGPVVHVNGKTYVLELTEELKLGRFDGMTVRIRATRGEMRHYVGPMIAHAKGHSFRVLHVQNVRLAEEASLKHDGEKLEIAGRVQLYRHIRFGRGAVGITVAGNTYWLDFTGQDALYDKATKSTGQRVRIIGTLRASDGAVEVTGVEVVAPEQFYRETVSVEVRGFLQEAPRRGDMMELAIYPPFRALQMNVHGRVLALQFPGDRALFCKAYEMVGQTVTLRGRMVGGTLQVTQVDPPPLDMLLPVVPLAPVAPK
jgi:hypothetical protein